jgi:hypothetical protein
VHPIEGKDGEEPVVGDEEDCCHIGFKVGERRYRTGGRAAMRRKDFHATWDPGQPLYEARRARVALFSLLFSFPASSSIPLSQTVVLMGGVSKELCLGDDLL